MIVVKKAPTTQTYDIHVRKQLEYLYARISMLDTLIHSLEQYDRFQAKVPGEGKLRTA